MRAGYVGRMSAAIGGSFTPKQLANLKAWYDGSNISTITKAYQNITQTGTGTSGSKLITASADVSAVVPPGAKIRANGVDIYTVASVSTVSINTVETLVNNYVANALALDKVSQWNDKSINANNAVQGTASLQPVYIPSAFNNKSGLNTLSAQAMTVTNMALTAAFTIFVVNSASSTSGTAILLGTNNSGDTAKIGRATTTDVIRVINAGSSDNSLTYPTINTANIFTINRDNSNIVNAAFNRALYTTLYSGSAQSGTFNLASLFRADATNGQTWIGDVLEIVIYSRNLSLNERRKVEKYLSKKWGTP